MYWTKRDLIEQRGWSRSLIYKFLKPDDTLPDWGCKVNLYSIEKVRAVEASKEFSAAKQASRDFQAQLDRIRHSRDGAETTND